MNKTTIPAVGFKRKPYAKPRMKVAIINEIDIICQSPSNGASTQSLDEEDFNWGSKG